MAVKNEKSEYTMYRGRPLVRSGRTIYYGCLLYTSRCV